MSKAIEIKAPNKIVYPASYTSMFLAGSIEMGKAEPWQERVISELSEKDIAFLNPRRDSWDSSLKQEIDEPVFNKQVNWELDALEKADYILMYFDPNTKSPISLLELGLFARTRKLIVCCPEGFWRKGNVDIMCSRYDIRQVRKIEDLILMAKIMAK